MTGRGDIDRRVREGALLRIAADLLVPYGELGSLNCDELLQTLAGLGITPSRDPQEPHAFWVEGACGGSEPRDEVTVLKRDGDAWVIGYWERGSFGARHRFDREGDACRWLLHDLVAHHVTSMGSTTRGPHVRDEFRAQLLEVLDEVTRLAGGGAGRLRLRRRRR